MKKVISYSLYGNIEKYTHGAIRNAEELSTFYPGWEGWFYVGRTVPKEITDKLKSLGMKVIFMDGVECPTATLWRFLVFADKNVEYAIIRDTDSRLSEREAVAVSQWLRSDKSFHIMRDHPHHSFEISAGMWGARAGKLRDIEDLIQNWHGEKVHFVDQIFLKKVIYPRAYIDSFIHADFHAYEPYAVPFSTKRDGLHFVGEVFDENDVADKNQSKQLEIETYGRLKKLFYGLTKMFSREKRKMEERTGDMRVVHVSTSLSSVSAASRLITAERLLGIDALALLESHGKLDFPCYRNTLTFRQKIVRKFSKILRRTKNKYRAYKSRFIKIVFNKQKKYLAYKSRLIIFF